MGAAPVTPSSSEAKTHLFRTGMSRFGTFMTLVPLKLLERLISRRGTYDFGGKVRLLFNRGIGLQSEKVFALRGEWGRVEMGIDTVSKALALDVDSALMWGSLGRKSGGTHGRTCWLRVRSVRSVRSVRG